MQLETVGEIVRILRSRLDLEQVELARACGWRDASAVSRIETDRIRPTRRTLTKLADALAKPEVTGSPREVMAWLFRAAGILPTSDDVRQVELDLPDIESWGQPAFIMDFGWYVWRVNDLAVRMLGLPANHRGRNYLELLFDPKGPIRQSLGHRWERAAVFTLNDFKSDTARQADRRWYKKLLARLNELPDFERLWHQAVGGWPGPVHQRRQTTLEEGSVAVVRLNLTADPRLVLTHVVPEDASMTRKLVEGGMMLA